MFSASAKKRQRVGSSGRLSSYADNAETKAEDSSIAPALSLRRSATTITPDGFNDPATADVLLRLQLEGSPDLSALDGVPEPDLPFAPSLELHLNSSPLRRSGYFAARLSDRWLRPDPAAPVVSSSSGLARLTLKIPNPCYSRRPFDAHVTVLKLLYTLDFTGSIVSATDALELLPVALELLFDDCIRACVRFLEAVPWTDEEEEGVLGMIPFLREEESRDLLGRVFPSATMDGDGKTLSEEMLHALILKAIHSNPRLAAVKAFVAKLLKDYSSRDSVQNVLDRAFLESLGAVKEMLGEYASPDFRVAGDNDETEAIHRLKLHAAMVNARNLFWLVERMLELRVADTAAREWSQQPALTADLQKTFREDGWRNIAPGLPSLVLRCTYGLANAIAAGSILAPRQVRVEFVRQWLPVLNVCREKTFPINGQKMIFQDMEETFLQIISTLPLRDAHDLLQQCLCFSARDFGGCPHLVLAFNTWFRRANMHPDFTR
ncbi:BTB/POZ domain-containing protein [Platanthera zijinensis]|uniref:BTB/POZ domain-containing protein n=1 Tax=Platanthera zijinensis TaxID=2320716 RepID=A0AAP0B8C3_9ASPA